MLYADIETVLQFDVKLAYNWNIEYCQDDGFKSVIFKLMRCKYLVKTCLLPFQILDFFPLKKNPQGKIIHKVKAYLNRIISSNKNYK